MKNLAIIGVGKHAQQVLIPAIEESGEFNLCALATSSANKAETLKEKFPNLRIFPNYESALSSPLIDCVHIALPNHLHFDISAKALSKKKIVICEKPVALNSNEAKKLLRVADEFQSPVFAAYMYQHHAQHRLAKELIENNSIGEVTSLVARFCYELPNAQNIRLDKSCAGGALNDAGCYLLHLALSLFGSMPFQITAKQRINQQYQIDEESSILLEFSAGKTADLLCSLNSNKRINDYKIIGTGGEIVISPAFVVPRKKRNQVLLRTKSGFEKRFDVAPMNQYCAMYSSIAKELSDNLNLEKRDTDISKVAALMEAATLSSSDATTIRIPHSQASLEKESHP